MKLSATIDFTNFQAALRQLYLVKDKKLPDLVNQAALDVAGKNFDDTPPTDVQAERSKISAYLNTPISTRIKLATSGKRKGKFIRKGGRKKQLTRAVLILQARRKRLGLPGIGKGMKRRDIGQEITKLVGFFKSKSSNSAGFLKSVWIPIIRALNPVVQYKFPFAKTRSISRWPQSAGHGKVDIAKPGWNPVATLSILMNWKQSPLAKQDQTEKVRAFQLQTMQNALDWKAGKMLHEVEKALQEDFDKVTH